MPDDDPGQSPPEREPEPSDTLEILRGSPVPEDHDGDASSGSGSVGGSRGGTASGSTNSPTSSVDTILGRLVVEQGLATEGEIAECVNRKREDASDRSLADLLVRNNIVTDRQLTRLKSAVEAERSGQKLPGYRVIGKLGAGAMATVFKAKQISLDRLVAIKVLPRKFSNNPQFIERFYAEGRAAAQMNHPNIVQAFDVAKAGEFHYFVMEYVEGETVHDAIVRDKRYQEDEALDIIIMTADALRHAHEKGLIHRDVKPKNIIITPNGVAKLADLGLARAIDDKDAALAEKGKAYGTPYYISPEQIRGEVNVGPQADIYSLGATLYHMVTGNVPFNGKNPTEVMQKHLKAPLVAPDHVNPKLSTGISEVIEMMMAKDRRDRYKDAADLLVDLRAVRTGELPPIAHKDAPAETLKAIASSEAAQSAPIAVDKTREPSPFANKTVQSVIFGLVVFSVIWMGIAFFALFS
ncbi:MAG: serine/threonine-protein kinase [Phycisphaerales bacterium]